MLSLVCSLAIIKATMVDPTPATLQNVSRIVCLGDSITQQGNRPGGYVWLLRESLQRLYPGQHIQVFGAGIGGQRSNDMLQRLQRDVLDLKPNLVTISVGVNDVWHGFYDNHPEGNGPRGIALDDYKRNVREMVRQIQALPASVVLLESTPIGEDPETLENRKARAYNTALAEIASSERCTLVAFQKPFQSVIAEVRKFTGSRQNVLTVDGVHMNRLGNRVMATQVLQTLGVGTPQILAIEESLEQAESHALPELGPLPKGIEVSRGAVASSSSAGVGFGPELALINTGQRDNRWIAGSGDYRNTPWWQIDLGATKSLTGVELTFEPLDAWRYRVEVSEDGRTFAVLADRSEEQNYLRQVRHTFASGVRGRYVRVSFVRPPNDLNWPSLSKVVVFGG